MALLPNDDTLSVTQLNLSVRNALRESFPEAVWVRGEIQRYHESAAGHAYFDLVEKDEIRDRVKARVRVALFRDDRRAVMRRLAEQGVNLRDDVDVRIGGRVSLYPDRGEYQVVMHDVDPTFTLGALAAERARLLRALDDEGLLRANATLTLPLVPLRIGLVSSGGSAAFSDFVHELGSSPFAFRLVHADVRVQGNAAAGRMASAVRSFATREVDVIVLVRGGGSRTDLAPFDAERLARAIATSPIPVLTGIGHETDRAVADELAHSSFKTPTAAAQALVSRVSAFAAHLDDRAVALARLAREHTDGEAAAVLECARRARRAATAAGALPRRDIRGLEHRLVGGAPRRIEHAHAESRGGGERIARSVPRRLGAAQRALDASEARVRALDPRRVLERGYSITRRADGTIAKRAAELGVGSVLVTELAAGEVTSRVEESSG